MLSHFSCVRLFVALWTVACRLPCLWDSLDKNTGVVCLAHLQGIFPTQELNHVSYVFMSPALVSKFFTTSTTWEALRSCKFYLFCMLEVSGTPLQYSCLENPMDGGAWWAAVHGVAKSRTRLSDFTFTFHFHALEKEMATHSSVLAWRIPGTGGLVGCRLWGRTESDTTEAT